MKEAEKIRLVFTEPVYQKNPYWIPIEKIGNSFNTGQDLSFEKMTGEKELTDEEKEKYPFVIDPSIPYKVDHHRKFTRGDAADEAILKLLHVCGKIADSKFDYDVTPQKYFGYVYDQEKEAVSKNVFSDYAFEAESYIRKLTQEQMFQHILLFNYKLPVTKFNSPTAGISQDLQRSKLIELSRKFPNDVINSSTDKNPGLKNEIFILELIHTGVLTQRSNNDIFFDAEYIGSSLDDVKRFLTKEANSGYRNRWGAALQRKKGQDVTVFEKTVEDPKKKFNELSVRMKAFLFDDNADEATAILPDLKKYFKKAQSIDNTLYFDIEKVEEKIRDIKAGVIQKRREDLHAELKDIKIEELQRKVRHHKTPYVEEECIEFWEDADKLIEYMVEKKMVTNAD